MLAGCSVLAGAIHSSNWWGILPESNANAPPIWGHDILPDQHTQQPPITDAGSVLDQHQPGAHHHFSSLINRVRAREALQRGGSETKDRKDSENTNEDIYRKRGREVERPPRRYVVLSLEFF